MRTEKSLGDGLGGPGQPALGERDRFGAHRYDAAAKQLLSHAVLLAYIMKNALEEYRDIPLGRIAKEYIENDSGQNGAGGKRGVPSDAALGPRVLSAPLNYGLRNEDDSLDEGTVRFDILFRARRSGAAGSTGLVVNIEPQAYTPSYPLIKRGVYYTARLLSSQRGLWGRSDDYGSLEKVCSIWLCQRPPERERNTIVRYALSEEAVVGSVRRDPAEYDLQEIVLVGLPEAGGYNGFTETMATLLSLSTSVNEKMMALESQLGAEYASEFRGDVGYMATLGEYVVDCAIKEGIESAMLASIKSLMERLSFTAQQAMDALGIPESERGRYAELLKG